MSSGIPFTVDVGDGEEIARSPPGLGDAFPQAQTCQVEGDEQKSYLLPTSKSFLQESSQSDQCHDSQLQAFAEMTAEPKAGMHVGTRHSCHCQVIGTNRSWLKAVREAIEREHSEMALPQFRLKPNSLPIP